VAWYPARWGGRPQVEEWGLGGMGRGGGSPARSVDLSTWSGLMPLHHSGIGRTQQHVCVKQHVCSRVFMCVLVCACSHVCACVYLFVCVYVCVPMRVGRGAGPWEVRMQGGARRCRMLCGVCGGVSGHMHTAVLWRVLLHALWSVWRCVRAYAHSGVVESAACSVECVEV